MPDPKRHAEDRGVIESFLRNIPGFRGYLEKEYRRDSDKLLREHLSDQLRRGKRALDDFARGLVDQGQIDSLPQCDRLRGRMDKIIARIDGAMRGYSGFFDFVQINESALDMLYRHDKTMVETAQSVRTALEEAATAQSAAGELVLRLMRTLDELEAKLDQRLDLLRGVEEADEDAGSGAVG